MRPAPTVTNSIGRMCFRVMEDRNELLPQEFSEGRWIGRRIDRLGGESIFIVAAAPALLSPMTKEKGTFLINGKPHVAEYEARTTLWEVIAMNAGLTGNQPKLQSGQLRRMQRAGGRSPYLLLPYAGDGGCGQEDSHHRRRGRREEFASIAADRAHARRGGLRILHGGMGCHGERAAGQESESIRG